MTGRSYPALLGGALALCAVLFCAAPALPQPSSGAGGDDALCAARLCVREAGWSSPADCAAILQTLHATSRGDEGVCDRIARVGRAAREHRRWADALPADPNAGPPDGWPSSAPWEGHGERWRRVLDAHRRWIAGRAPRPCPAPPLAWGDRRDDPIALSRGLVRLDCGSLLRFWGRP